MLKRWQQRRQIFSEDNTFLLTNALHFQNTSSIKGSYFTRGHRGDLRFNGFTFRVDDSSVQDAFSKGFCPKYYEWYGGEMWNLNQKINSPQFGGGATIQSYVCYYAASLLGINGMNIFLIDLRRFGGTVRNRSSSDFVDGKLDCNDGYLRNDNIYRLFPITKQIHSLETLAPVPGAKILGVVTNPTDYYHNASQLQLHANPDYEGGMDSVRAVVNLFNERGGGSGECETGV